MPKSKRNKNVSLTKTSKKDRGCKQALVNEIRQIIDQHDRVFVFRYDNMRSRHMKNIRADFRIDSRIFMGKNTLMMRALGVNDAEEYADNLQSVCKHIKGHCGLLMTNRSEELVKKYFEDFEVPDFANAGFIAPETITLPVGPSSWPTGMMDQLRRLGLLVEVEDSQLWIRKEFILCEEGEPVTVEQAKLLALHDKKISTFKLILACVWSRNHFEEYLDSSDLDGVMDMHE